MIILVNDIPEMRKAFAGLEIRTLDHQYSVRRGKGTPVRELVIRNF
ncbi:hypothetical protein HB016_004841 [Salmonella enterica subsp. enterica]|nr:hypothetical protein [Salmonella enterica]EEP4634707.1 hypothetical protein [Salmonella enterica subsp. enterica serovar Poano]EFO7636284.1 hypothetical protein [Salmonella enterica]